MQASYSRDPVVERSLRHSLRDGVAYAVMAGGGESYFSAFAIHLRATAREVGVLTSLPLLVGALFQLVSVALGHRTGNRRTVIMAGAWLQVLTWFPLALLPLLFPDSATTILLGSLILYYSAGNMVTPQWGSLMGDLVPEKVRGRFFAHRTRLASVTNFLSLVGAGVVLQLFADAEVAAAGFLVLFAVAASARVISALQLARMEEPTNPSARRTTPRPSLRPFDSGDGAFVRFTLFFASMQFAVGIAGPFFTVYMLRDLHFTYIEFMTNTAVSILLQVVTLKSWGRISDAFGNRLVLTVTALAIPLLPALWMVSDQRLYLLAIQALSGTAWGGFTLSAGNYLFDLIPQERRATQLAWHNVFAAVGAFLGALLGGWLAMHLPVTFSFLDWGVKWHSVFLGLFLVSTLTRYVVDALFLPTLVEPRPVHRFTWGGLAYLVTGQRRWLRRRGERGTPLKAGLDLST